MGQSQSSTSSLPDMDSVEMNIRRREKILMENYYLTYDDFKFILSDLNALSRKCIDPSGKQVVFFVKRGTDSTLLWKTTVEIACVKVDPQTRKINSYKFLNLKQFMCVYKTFQLHLASLVSSEKQRTIRRVSQSLPKKNKAASNLDITNFSLQLTSSMLIDSSCSSSNSISSLNSPITFNYPHNDHVDECSICLDRSTEVILPCTHSFCTPCIEQWNANNKTCPICCEILESNNDTWVMSNIPGVEEINEKICAEFMNLVNEE